MVGRLSQRLRSAAQAMAALRADPQEAVRAQALDSLINLLHLIGLALKSTGMEALQGDKVKMKDLAHLGARGLVEEVDGRSLVVRLEQSDEVVSVPEGVVTNFSLAARKAWQSMPARNVGRPRGSRVSDRVSVTLRIDRELWERFRRYEEGGLIDDRTARVNGWLKRMLDELAEEKGALDGIEDD